MAAESVEFAPEKDAGLFGGEWALSTQEVIVVGVPWEPTVSYGRSTSQTPSRLVPVSHQLDIYDAFLGKDFLAEVGMLRLNESWLKWNRRAIAAAEPIIENGGRLTVELIEALDLVNSLSERLNAEVEKVVDQLLDQGKTVGILGGDHSSPLGAIRALSRRHPGMGILHIDAHHDLRDAYEGFTYSHASIMFNALREAPELGHLVSVGIRDFSRDEAEFASKHEKVTTFYDRDLHSRRFKGENWNEICLNIVSNLPESVYVSFDIDGLEPHLCPGTGTPVPGGLSFGEAVHLLETVVTSGRRIVAFDLCEVGVSESSDWDLNVGSRILHKLAALAHLGRRNRH